MDGLIAYILAKKHTDAAISQLVDAGFKVQVEQDRSILETVGEEKILYLIPKESGSATDGYDEYVYANNNWECVGSTDIDLSNYVPKEKILTIPDGTTEITRTLIEQLCPDYDATQISIPDSVEIIDECAFQFFSYLKEIWIPDSVTEIRDQAFSFCTSLKRITGTYSLQAFDYVGAEVFAFCSSLQVVEGGFWVRLPYVSESMFYNAFTSCALPRDFSWIMGKGLEANATEIKERAFGNCGGLTWLVIPNTITTFDATAINSCSNLDDIIVLGTPQINLATISDFSVSSSCLRVFVKEENLSFFETDPIWSTFYDDGLIQPIEDNLYYFRDKGIDLYLFGYDVTGIGNQDTLAKYNIKDAYTKTEVNRLIPSPEVYIGDTTPTGDEVLWVDTASSPTPPPTPTNTVFGVLWDYSLSSPALTRLTLQTDPLGVVTNTITTEPTACIGSTGGQSEFDNYLPWSGMVRKNYVNGQVVDFVDYSNGETYVYIPEFWSKIVDDSVDSKMYFYISSAELEGFTKHPGSGRYMSRYESNDSFLSASGFMPKVNTSLTAFRAGITAIDNKHFQYDFSTYNAIELLYIVEFANLNSQAKIGAGITSSSVAQTTGQTDILTYHTGRIDGTDNVSGIQYRWIENLWGNVWDWIDGILINSGLVYICNEPTKYASSITSDYISTELYTPTTNGFITNEQKFNNCYLFPKAVGGSDSTYVCDSYSYVVELRGLHVGGSNSSTPYAGLFYWAGNHTPGEAFAFISGRSILILGGNS